MRVLVVVKKSPAYYADVLKNDITGKEPSDANFAQAGSMVAQHVKPITDIRGCEQYRREICRVLTIRVLKRALKRTMD